MKNKTRAVNISGNRYGRLVALELSSRRFSSDGKSVKHYWRCVCDCGSIKHIAKTSLTTGKTRSCGCLRDEISRSQPRSDKSSSWRGGRRIDGGYVMLYMPDYPGAKSNGYVREHKYVMEKHIGRRLNEKESVHHINGDKQDNRIDNLELWSKSQPSGQRVSDKLKWAYEIIKIYGK